MMTYEKPIASIYALDADVIATSSVVTDPDELPGEGWD